MLSKKEIDALSSCVGRAIGEFGVSEITDLANSAIEKLRAGQQGARPTAAVLPENGDGENREHEQRQ